ncbi:MAG TPA: hypothetical protein VGX00_01755 [Thermoplasmata archaeon]|nr:hypothetical protein [Thermoplasmata archaeon]
MRSSARFTMVLGLAALGTVGLAIGLLTPLWSFNESFPGTSYTSPSRLFSIGPPGDYFVSPNLQPGTPRPVQSALDLDIALWADLAIGILAGLVAVFRGAIARDRAFFPALVHGATIVDLGLSVLAAAMIVAWGPTAYAPGTQCASCTTYSGQARFFFWSWTPQVGAFAVLIAAVAFVAAFFLEVRGGKDPVRWPARYGSVGVASGIALFSLVIGDNWQAWYPTGTPNLVLWILIVGIPVVSAVFAIRAIRRFRRQRPRESH